MDAHNTAARVLAEIGKKARGRHGIVFVSGNFNIIHPSHLQLLQLEADCGDFLVVGVNVDSTTGITVPAASRAGQAARELFHSPGGRDRGPDRGRVRRLRSAWHVAVGPDDRCDADPPGTVCRRVRGRGGA